MAVKRSYKADMHLHLVTLVKPAAERGPAGTLRTVAHGARYVEGGNPRAPRLPNRVRAAGFANSAAAVLGRASNPVDALIAKFEGLPDSQAAELLGMEFAKSIKGAV